jgi:hypothetical protein
MVCFEEMFRQSRGKPIVYQQMTLVMKDEFPTERCARFRFVFESCNSEWRQGAYLRINGTFTVNKQKIKNAVAFWQGTAPETVEFEAGPGVDLIEVRNIWDTGDGVMQSWHNGAAMIVEIVPVGRRYRCNDGFADDDLDDIVFRLERVR